MDCLIDWAQSRKLRKLTLRVFADNDRAIATYRSLGFVEEGRLTDDILRGDGTYCDMILMAKFFQ